MQVPQVPPPPVPAPPLPRVPAVGRDGGSFAARLLRAATTTSVPSAGPPTSPSTARPSTHALAARGRTEAVTLGAMLAARGGLATPTMFSALQAPVVGGVATGPFAGHTTVVPPTVGRISSDFGMRIHPISGRHRHHDGMDIAAPTGTPVRSVAAGTVVRTGDRGGYGLTVDVDHGNGTVTRYAHLSSIDVTVGEQLAAGTQLGAVGSTGASTGPHLHVEVRVDDEPVDPAGLW